MEQEWRNEDVAGKRAWIVTLMTQLDIVKFKRLQKTVRFAGSIHRRTLYPGTDTYVTYSSHREGRGFFGTVGEPEQEYKTFKKISISQKFNLSQTHMEKNTAYK
jgi:hypothetical protein